MGFYAEHVLPRAVDIALSGKAFAQLHERVAMDLEGDVLEVGFGSGRNVPLYPPAVARVLAIDPSVGGRKLAAKRLAASPVPVDFLVWTASNCHWTTRALITFSRRGRCARSPM